MIIDSMMNAAQQLSDAALLDRVNSFLTKVEQTDAKTLNADISRVSSETGLSVADVRKVVNSVLTILEERREERGIYAGQAHTGYIVRSHGGWVANYRNQPIPD